ncbi:putative ribonuclease H-like domain-containing protein [Tanacetum coccineum]
MTHPHPKGNFVPKAVLMKSGIEILNTVGQNFSKAAVSVNIARPINSAYPRPTVNSARIASNVFNRAHTHGNVTTAGPKAVVSDNKINEANVVKTSACWVWRPKQKILDHVSRHNGASMNFKRFDYVDAQCRSKHMTRNKSYLSDYEEIDGGFIAFGGDPKGGRTTGKDKISTGGLTCLFAKATLDESNLWHRRLGHINFKTLNKLVRGNLVRDLKVKVIRCDNRTGFKNKVMNQFCEMKGIKREFSVAMTPQQNGVAKRKNRTLIEAARTMLADSKLPITFWAEAVNTACYAQNRVLVIKPHNKTPYELFLGRKPALSFMRPIGCPVTILNILDHLGEFDGKADEGFFVGYSTNSKAYRFFDIDALKISMNYKPVVAGNQTNGNAGTKENINAGQDRKKLVPDQNYILLPLLTSDLLLSKSLKDSPDAGFKPSGEEEKIDSEYPENEDSEVPNTEESRINQEQDANVNSTNNINTVSPTVNADDIENNAVDENIVYRCIDDPNLPNLEEIVYSDDDEEVGAEADMNNLATTVLVSPISTTRVHKDHPLEQIIGDIQSTPQTRRMTKNVTEHEEPKKTLVELPYGKRAIGTKWVYRNKKDDRVARNEAIRIFLAYASFMNFIVYQMDVKSAFLYGTIEEEVYFCQPPGFEDPEFSNKVYKVYVDDIIFGSTKKSLCTEFEQMMHKRFQMSSMGELTFFLGLQVKQKDDGIFISQDKYVADILKKFDFATVRTASTPIDTSKALLKDEEAADVDVHLYRLMIGSLMYLPASRPNIMFVVCACARFQVTPKVSHLHVVKRIFRYLKGQSKLGLWYLRDSPFDLEAFFDSDYAGASLDKKSTTGAEYVAAANCRGQTVIKEWEDIMERAVTTTSSLVAEQDILVYVARHSLTAVRHKLMLPGITYYCWYMNHAFKSSRQLLRLRQLMGERQIQALVDKKNVIITKKSVRSDLILDDAEGTECLPNDVIFEQLTLMGYENLTQKLTFYKAYFSSQWKFLIHTILQCLSAKTTAWNEFSSTMASAIICLATNQKFNFSKYIYDNMMKNLEGGVKFIMYQRFVQVFLDKQVEGMSKHKGIYVTPSYTKKIFANMKREGKGFSGRITPLFPTMMVQALEDMSEDSAAPTDSHSTPIVTQPSSSKPQKKKYIRKQRKDSGPTEPILDEATNKEPISTPSYDPP